GKDMQAARFHSYRKPLEIDDVPTPAPGTGQVVIRVESAGFCYSNLHIISGEIQILPWTPLTLGHESAGTGAATGDGVRAGREGESGRTRTVGVDSKIWSIGSANMDIRSFCINYETNFVVYDEAGTSELEADFER